MSPQLKPHSGSETGTTLNQSGESLLYNYVPMLEKIRSRYPSLESTWERLDAAFPSLSLAIGTVSESPWISVTYSLLFFGTEAEKQSSAQNGLVFYVHSSGSGSVNPASLATLRTQIDRLLQGLRTPPAGSTADRLTPEVAQAIKTLTGLTAKKIGELFPVARETFQRWLSGDLEPSAENLERMLALHHLVKEISLRKGGVKEWLLAPVDQVGGSMTPYDLLKRGRLSEVWDILLTTTSPKTGEIIRDAAGDYVLVPSGSRRSQWEAAYNPLEQGNEMADWLDEDEE